MLRSGRRPRRPVCNARFPLRSNASTHRRTVFGATLNTRAASTWLIPSLTERGHSPTAERLREALGWERLPEMTMQQREAYEAANQRAREEAQRFYGDTAA